MGCERCINSKVKAAQKHVFGHTIQEPAQAEIPLRFRWMLLNRAVDKLIAKLKAEQGVAEDLVHLALPSSDESSFDP